MARSKKRFIAGATCPECKAQDSMMLFVENDSEHVECVECHFRMSEHDQKLEESSKEVESKDVIGFFKPQ